MSVGPDLDRLVDAVAAGDRGDRNLLEARIELGQELGLEQRVPGLPLGMREGQRRRAAADRAVTEQGAAGDVTREGAQTLPGRDAIAGMKRIDTHVVRAR